MNQETPNVPDVPDVPDISYTVVEREVASRREPLDESEVLAQSDHLQAAGEIAISKIDEFRRNGVIMELTIAGR